METLSATHPDTFHLFSLSGLSHCLSVSLLTSVPQPRLFFVVFASVRIHLLYIYIPPTPSAYTVLYCTA